MHYFCNDHISDLDVTLFFSSGEIVLQLYTKRHLVKGVQHDVGLNDDEL